MHGIARRYGIYLALGAVALAASVGYYSFPMTEVPIGVDSAVFSYIGEVMAGGGVPYVDVFDHKGPLLYLLNFLGALGPSTWVLWLVEWLFLACSLCLCYEVGRAAGVGRLAAVAVPVLLVPYAVYRAEGGNLTEEYCLPFMLATVLVAIRALKGAPLRAAHALAVGACAACVLMLRFTVLLGLLPFYVAMVAVAGAKRGLRYALSRAALFSLGFAACAVPIVGWLALSGALAGFFGQYFAFNAAYAGDVAVGDRWGSLRYFSGDVALWLAVAASIAAFALCWARRHPRCGRDMVAAAANLAGLAMLFALAASSGRSYGHYLLAFVPGFAAAFYLAVAQVRRVVANRAAVAAAGMAFMLAAVYFPAGCGSVHEAAYRASLAEPRARVVEVLRGIAGDGEVLAVGNECWVYLEGGFRAPVPYAYRSDAMAGAYDAWLSGLTASDDAPAAIAIADYVALGVPLEGYVEAGAVEGFTLYRPARAAPA